jgi:hypothetical protein
MKDDENELKIRRESTPFTNIEKPPGEKKEN